MSGAGAVQAAGGLPVVASLPDVTSAKYGEMRAISEPFTVKARSGSGNDREAMPGKDGKGRKPYAPAGFEFYRQGKGWACRSVTIEDGKRRRRYLGYMSASSWADMQRSHSGPELRAAVKQWIEMKERSR